MVSIPKVLRGMLTTSSVIGMDRKEDRIVERPRRELSVTDLTISINYTQSDCTLNINSDFKLALPPHALTAIH